MHPSTENQNSVSAIAAQLAGSFGQGSLLAIAALTLWSCASAPPASEGHHAAHSSHLQATPDPPSDQRSPDLTREPASRAHTRVARPLSLPSPAFSRDSVLCAVGDTGTGSIQQFQVAKGLELAGCTHVLYLGDNFYDRGIDPELGLNDPQFGQKFEAPYRELINRRHTQFFITLGNHDDAGDVDAQVLYSQRNPNWYLPWHHYTVRMGENGQDFCIYSIYVNRLSPRQNSWLSEQIQQSSCRWKIVIGHHPVISSGTHGGLAYAGGSWPARVDQLKLAMSGADLYVSGHEHSYADEGNFSVSASGVDRNSQVRQLVVGTGGAGLYAINRHPAPNTNHVTISRFGFLKFNISRNVLSWTFNGLRRSRERHPNRPWDDVIGLEALHSCDGPWTPGPNQPHRSDQDPIHPPAPAGVSPTPNSQTRVNQAVLMPCLRKSS